MSPAEIERWRSDFRTSLIQAWVGVGDLKAPCGERWYSGVVVGEGPPHAAALTAVLALVRAGATAGAIDVDAVRRETADGRPMAVATACERA